MTTSGSDMTFDTYHRHAHLRNGRYRYDIAPLVEFIKMNHGATSNHDAYRLLAKLHNVHVNAVAHGSVRGLTLYVADAYAVSVGAYPPMVWPEWWDHAAAHDHRPCECKYPTFEPVVQLWPVCDHCGGQHAMVELNAWLRDTPASDYLDAVTSALRLNS